MNSGVIRTALVLGLLSLVGPFSIDMYLPAMPTITAEFATTEAAAQGTLSWYFIAFGLAQLVYGPWSDQVGRRVPLFAGMGLFIVGSAGAATAGSIESMMAWRFVQGLGGAVAMVVPRAIIRDMLTGVEATRMMAMIMLVIAISPMVAPLTGAGVLLFAGWRAIFVILCALAVVSILLTTFALAETLPPERRVPVNLRALTRGARRLLTDMRFIGLTLVAAFGFASFLLYIAAAPFVYAGQFGLTPPQFAVIFAINAIGFFGASQMAGPLGARLGLARVVMIGTGGFAAGTLILLALLWAGGGSGTGTLWLLVGGLFLSNAFQGLVIPTVMVMALDEHGDIAGLASSLGGTLQMSAGGVLVAASSPFFDGSATTMVAMIAGCAVIGLVLSAVTLRGTRTDRTTA